MQRTGNADARGAHYRRGHPNTPRMPPTSLPSPVLRLAWDLRPSSRNLLERRFDFAFASTLFATRSWRRLVGDLTVAIGSAEGIPLAIAWRERLDALGQVERHLVAARVATRLEWPEPRDFPPGPRHPDHGRANLPALRAVSDLEIARTAPVLLPPWTADERATARLVRAEVPHPAVLTVGAGRVHWYHAPLLVPLTREAARDGLFVRRARLA
jgi:hypothetical protein